MVLEDGVVLVTENVSTQAVLQVANVYHGTGEERVDLDKFKVK